MLKSIVLALAIASAAKITLPHQTMMQPNHWTALHYTELIDLASTQDCACDQAILGNGYCDDKCNSANCAWEHGDCGFAFNCEECKFVQLYPTAHFGVYTEIFDDMHDISPCCELRITQLSIEYDRFITGLRINYATLQDTFEKAHRGNSTVTGTVQDIVIEDDDAIVELSGTKGWYVNSLFIKTRKGHEYAIGDSEAGAQFENLIPAENFHLVAFGGGVGEFLEGIFFYIKATPDVPCGCEDSELGNGTCNPDCYAEECGWDLGDCVVPENCPCDIDTLVNKTCDPSCNVPECWNDLDACPIPNCQCPEHLLTNGFCDLQPECNNENCNYDNGQCEQDNCDCDETLIANNVCDDECNKLDCEFDGGDCGEPFRCDSCKFVKVGPLGGIANEAMLAFDHFNEFNPCCDLRISKITVIRGMYEIALGLSVLYKFDYDNEHYATYNRENTSEALVIDLEPKQEVVIQVSINTDGRGIFWYISFKTYSKLTGEYGFYEFGDASLGPIQTLNLDERYPVLGFYGDYAVSDLPMVNLGVYARSNPEEVGCLAELNNDLSSLGNGVCDIEYYNMECLLDKGDCASCDSCSVEEIYNDVCDPHCNTADCKYDNGSCKDLPPDCTCPLELFNNSQCDLECNNSQCNYDNGICKYPNCDCEENLMNNDYCNDECNKLDCEFDGGDCGEPFRCDSCKFVKVGPLGGIANEAMLAFDHFNEFNPCCDLRISKITVIRGMYEIALGLSVLYKFDYDNEHYATYNRGNTSEALVIDLEPKQEVVIQVSINTDGRGIFWYISFKTYSKLTGEYGFYEFGDASLGPIQTLNLDERYPVLGFYGNYAVSDLPMVNLGVYARSNPEEVGCLAELNNDLSSLGNGVCDIEYYNLECLHDKGDCTSCDSCSVEEIYNDVCDPHCNTADCKYDNGSCKDLPPDCTCPLDLYNNSQCDLVCNNEHCNYDNGQCEQDNCDCDETLIANDVCNDECNKLDCEFDGGDCGEPFRCESCKFVKVGPLGGIANEAMLAFDHFNEFNPCCDLRISKITVIRGWYEIALGLNVLYKFDYDNEHYATYNRENTSEALVIDLEPKQEVVIQVSINTDGRGIFWYISFKTYSKLTGEYGFYEFGDASLGPIQTLNLDERYPVLGFYGDYAVSDLPMVNLGVYARSNPEEVGCLAELNNDLSSLGNGVCDIEYYNLECLHDKGDCASCDSCSVEEIYNDVCDPHCNTADCKYDNGSCKDLPPDCTCPLELFNNSQCDLECNNSQCNYDNGICKYPNCDCDENLMNNDNCNDECNKLDCEFDGGDCGEPFRCESCKFVKVGPLGGIANEAMLAFDHFNEFNPCCDLRISKITVIRGWYEIALGLSVLYKFDYDNEHYATYNRENTSEALVIDLEPKQEVVIQVSINTDGRGIFWYISFKTYSKLTGEYGFYEFGDASLGPIQTLNLDERYPVLGFYGDYAVSDLPMVNLGVYARSNPEEVGCLAELNNNLASLGNGVCDIEYYNLECLHDKGDCASCDSCSVEEIYNDVCDPHCNTSDCNYDNGSCDPLPPDCTCPLNLYTNNECDLVCNNEQCNFDNGKCEQNNCTCDESLINNETCNDECNNVDCEFDGGDCGKSFRCDVCKFATVSPIGQLNFDPQTPFDHLSEFNPCCDLSISRIQVIRGINPIATGISVLYKYDYGEYYQVEYTRESTSVALDIDLESKQEVVIQISINTNDIGIFWYISFKTYSKLTGEYGFYEFGDASLGPIQTLNLDEKYPVVGFYGNYRIDSLHLVDLGVYARSNPEEGCLAEINNDLANLGNGICNIEYFTPECLNDKGDCISCDRCSAEEIYNDICDPQCNTADCNYDNGACPDLPPDCTCSLDLFNNFECDLECNNQECNFDNGVCRYPNCGCEENLLSNGTCNEECNTIDCEFDGSDCGKSFRCDACKFATVGPIGQLNFDPQTPFDHLSEFNPCCDLSISRIQVIRGVNPIATGISVLYKYDYGEYYQVEYTRESTSVALDIDLESKQEVVIQVSINTDDIGIFWYISFKTYSKLTGEYGFYEFGDASLGPIQTLNLDEKYPVVGFYGNYRINSLHLVDLGVYARSNPEEGCLAEINNDQSSLGNGICNIEYYTPECLDDKGDCEPCNRCSVEEIYNDVCDPHCNTADCNYDNGACPDLPPDCTCPLDLFNNSECDLECNNQECNFDNGVCKYPNCGCDQSLINNDTCNDECNNIDCEFDGGDCGKSFRCDACKFATVGPIGQLNFDPQTPFDHLSEFNPCCDLSISRIQVIRGVNPIATGISVLYKYDYGEYYQVEYTREYTSVALDIDLESKQEVVIQISINTNDIGIFWYISFKTYSKLTGEYGFYEFGDANFGPIQTLNLDEKYPVVGFYGNYRIDSLHLVDLGVYARSNPEEGCLAEINNDQSSLGNGICNIEYYTPECLNDKGDCVSCTRCTVEEIYDDVCDPHCNTADCNYDNGSCDPLPPNCTCPLDLYTNSECDQACNNEECKYDQGNCVFPNCPCGKYLLENGVCDEECNTIDCQWDSDDCLTPVTCLDCKFKQFEPVGNLNPDNIRFDDLKKLEVCCAVSIRQMKVYYSTKEITGIATQYEVNGQIGESLSHGSSSGDVKVISLGDQEYLTHLEGYYSASISYLKFYTSLGNEYEVGQQIGTAFSFDVHVDQTYELVGFLGLTDDEITLKGIGAYYLIKDACKQTECNEEIHRYNGQCDYDLCYNEVCGFDWGDCNLPNCSCEIEQLFNDVCDIECNTAECNFDNSSCKVDGCNTCPNDEIENGSCNLACNTEACNYDGGDCLPNCPCSPTSLGNGVCDIETCYTEACEFDRGDCDIPGCDCNPLELNNGACDLHCNTEACHYDNGICEYPGCRQCNGILIGDGNCDPDCNVEECNYDGNDCPFPGCQCSQEQMDGECAPECNNLTCQFSDSNCGNPFACKECKYEVVGGIFTGVYCLIPLDFDHFAQIQPCCDIELDALYFYKNQNGALSSIRGDYTLDYGLVKKSLISGTETELSTEFETKIGLNGRKLVKLESFSNTDGNILSVKLTYENGETDQWGSSDARLEVQQIDVTNQYQIIGIKGSICVDFITSLSVYVRTNPGEGSCPCVESGLLNNGVCDYEECYDNLCAFDGDDCVFPGCPDDCTVHDLFNDLCDLQCNLAECNNFDSDKCIPGCDCQPGLLGDGQCQHNCNTEACLFDGYDCRLPGCTCPEDLLGNMECNEECNTLACNWDDYDCADSFECEECGFLKSDHLGKIFENTYDLSQDAGICCQVAVSKLYGSYNDSLDCLTLFGVEYIIDGNAVSLYTTNEPPIGFHSFEPYVQTIDKIKIYEQDGKLKGIEHYDSNGNVQILGKTDGYEPQEFSLTDSDGQFYNIVSFFGSIGPDSCLSSFGVYYHVLDSCECDKDVYLNNGICDYPTCYNKLCGFDWGECPQDCPCDIEKLYNDSCDLECNIPECLSDNGACPVNNCDVCNEELLNDTCDLKCNTEACKFDNGACLPNCQCNPDILGDLVCDYDAGCYTEACGFDKGDCDKPDCDCSVDLLWNNECNPECNTERCGFDGGECKYPGCTACYENLLGDGTCNSQCNTKECGYDGGDCDEYPGCQCDLSLLGDNQCNEECNTIECKFDGYDCDAYSLSNECPDLCKYFWTPMVGREVQNAIAFSEYSIGGSYFCCSSAIVGIEFNSPADTKYPINELTLLVSQNYNLRLDKIQFSYNHNHMIDTFELDGKWETAQELARQQLGEGGFIFEEGEYGVVFYGNMQNESYTYITILTNLGRLAEFGNSQVGDGGFEINLTGTSFGLVSFIGFVHWEEGQWVSPLSFNKLGLVVKDMQNFNDCKVPELIGDGVCQFDQTYNRLCLYDRGDCSTPPECNCTESQYYNGICDYECNIEACNFDNNSCEKPGCTCSPELLTDDKCDLHCNTEECGYDPQCHIPGCSICGADLLENGVCDEQCNTSECNFDNYACTRSFGCEDCQYIHISTCDTHEHDFDSLRDIDFCCQLDARNVQTATNSDGQWLIWQMGFEYYNNGQPIGNGVLNLMDPVYQQDRLVEGDYFTSVDIQISEIDEQVIYIVFNSNQGTKHWFGSPDSAPNRKLRIYPDVEGTPYKLVGASSRLDMRCYGFYFQVLDVCECSDEQKFNNTCDMECFNEQCGFDWSDCDECPCGSEHDLLTNGVCDPKCNVEACQYDMGDCIFPGCTSCGEDLLLNGTCDVQCNFEECGYDNGDCKPGCFCDHNYIGNGECNLSCNNEACDFDNNECLPGCDCWADLNNCTCDAKCNTEACLWDNGECLRQFECGDEIGYCDYVKQGEFGNHDPSAQSFDDLKELQPCCTNSVVSIEAAEIDGMLVSLRTTYSQEDTIYNRDARSDGNYESVTLDPSDPVVIVRIGVGEEGIISLELVKQSGTSFKVGGDAASVEEVVISENNELAGFAGSFTEGGHFNSLAVYLKLNERIREIRFNDNQP